MDYNCHHERHENELLDSSQSADGRFCAPVSKLYSVRLVVAFLSLLGTATMYITRVNLNIAILAMVPQVPQMLDPFPIELISVAAISNASISSGSGNTNLTSDLRPAHQNGTLISGGPASNLASLLPPAEFDWSPPVQGIILGAFFTGYTATQVIGGRIAESYVSPTKVIFFGLSASGILNLVTPCLARWSLVIFIISRIVLGAAQGLVYPAFYCLFYKWIPANERSTFIPWLDGGTTIGTILISALSGHIIVFFSQLGGWPVVFYISGILALVWCLVWAMVVRSSPEEHPFISKAELDLIVNGRKEEGELSSLEPNWRAILSSTVFYAVLAPKITYGIVFDFVSLKIPAYLQDVIQMPVSENGIAVAVIMIGYMVTLLTGGLLADCLIAHSTLGKCKVRKLFQLLAAAIMAGSLFLLPLVGTSFKWVNVLLLAACMGGYGFTSGGDVPLVADLSGPLSGSVFALINTVCSISGFTVPYIVGVVIQSAPSSPLLWSSLINGCAVLVVAGTIMFTLFITVHLQTDWAKPSTGYIDIEEKLSSRARRRNSRYRSIGDREEKAALLAVAAAAKVAAKAAAASSASGASGEEAAGVAASTTSGSVSVPLQCRTTGYS